MGPIEDGPLVELDERHIAQARMLSDEAGWNQVEADWKMMMAAGTVIGLFDAGRLIATALTLPHGNRFGWISMVLVTGRWQRKGLATRLLLACIDRLEGAGLVPVLDATVAGETVYRPLGFEAIFGYWRWQHEAVETIGSRAGLERFHRPADRQWVGRIDGTVFGGQRPVILDGLASRSEHFSLDCRPDEGFLLGRDGRNATQIGPVSAADDASALAMFDAALAGLEGTVFIDACDHQTALRGHLQSLGFQRQRPFLRMSKGVLPSFGRPAHMYALAGPELG